jgi:hypothetical protein
MQALLSGGDRRSIGRAAEVVAAVRASPRRLTSLVAALGGVDPIVALRAADAIEKLSRTDSARLRRYRATILHEAVRTKEPATRWNLIQTLSRLPAGRLADRALARRLEVWYLTDRSAIVQTCALDALVAMGERDALLRPAACRVFADARASGSAAVRARARRLRATWLEAATGDTDDTE